MPSSSTSNITSTIFFQGARFRSKAPHSHYMDNLPFMNSIVGEKGASVKSKDIMIRLSLINEAYINGDIDFKHMSTSHIPSDMLSKLVPAPTHQHLRKFLNGQSPLINDSTLSIVSEKKARSDDNFL